MRTRRASDDRRRKAARAGAASEAEVRHQPSPTAVAAEAQRTGVLPRPPSPRRAQALHPREARDMSMGDPDDDALDREYVGDDLPGGSNPTPDQNVVDLIGHAYGVDEEDAGELRTSAEVLSRRDRRRHELRPPARRR
jgi:hypothetical protein